MLPCLSNLVSLTVTPCTNHHSLRLLNTDWIRQVRSHFTPHRGLDSKIGTLTYMYDATYCEKKKKKSQVQRFREDDFIRLD